MFDSDRTAPQFDGEVLESRLGGRILSQRPGSQPKRPGKDQRYEHQPFHVIRCFYKRKDFIGNCVRIQRPDRLERSRPAYR